MDASLAYLESDAAMESLAKDLYTPKWDSPWWHMLLLFELGEVDRIPRRVVEYVAAGMNDRARFDACFCAVGCMAQILHAHGIELPWMESYFVRAQMRDGGLNCDDTAYTACEVASSMVGTVPALEAMLCGDPKTWSAKRREFVDKAAACVIGRAFVRGSDSVHNAEEREAATHWGELAFPRFYFYDVLRGMAAVATWVEKTGGSVPRALWREVEPVIGRDALTSAKYPRTRFALLDEVSRIGDRSPALEKQWARVKSVIG